MHLSLAVLINVLQIQWCHLFTAPTIYTHSKSKLLPLFQIKGPFCDMDSVCLNKIVTFDWLDVLDEDFYDKIENYCLWQKLNMIEQSLLSSYFCTAEHHSTVILLFYCHQYNLILMFIAQCFFWSTAVWWFPFGGARTI